MATKIGINGFGRIGRLTFRTITQRHKGELEIVAVNDLTDTKTNAHLLKWDSSYGRYPGTVEASANSIIVDGKNVMVIAERDPTKIPWRDFGAEIVIESTGFFEDATKAAGHLQGGAKKVIISAPATNEDATLVLGVNADKYDAAKHKVISNASCTTNCVAPVVKVLHDNFGVVKGLMTTVHSYTGDQRIQDTAHSSLRRARAAALSMVPTTTGAARLVGVIIPELKGKIDGLSIRVPTPTVSVIDFVAEVSKTVTKEQVNQAFQAAANGPLKGIVEYCTEELVSVDFKGNPASAIIDALSTMAIGNNMVKVVAWYDNEWGYSCRLGDMAAFVASKGL
ncbi:MAG: type I glyceraldehyde-3-phosphate dehydrogenase [Chloroflexi bacterium RBG_16_51_9]|nr:MAG: type I glyceraldehyde-3-phosphate dehydrogenase [Chloroflexi bacterium RBG_16_51_9]